MSKSKCPYNIHELKSMENLTKRGIPISKEQHMKLIEFAKGFADDPAVEQKIVESRGTEEQKKTWRQKAREKLEDKSEKVEIPEE